MPSFSKNDVVLVRYPFTDLSGAKIRPAVIVSPAHPSGDSFLVPLTSKLSPLFDEEFVLANWAKAGLSAPTAVKRGMYTTHATLILKLLGRLSDRDSSQLNNALREWLGLG
jgi:mRNA interferase MazF